MILQTLNGEDIFWTKRSDGTYLVFYKGNINVLDKKPTTDQDIEEIERMEEKLNYFIDLFN